MHLEDEDDPPVISKTLTRCYYERRVLKMFTPHRDSNLGSKYFDEQTHYIAYVEYYVILTSQYCLGLFLGLWGRYKATYLNKNVMILIWFGKVV